MNTDKTRAMGVLNLLFQIASMYAIRRPRVIFGPLSQQDSSRFSVFLFSLIGIGIGLVLLRKWAVLYFCLASASVAICLFFESIWLVEFPFNLFYMTLAVAFVPPPVLLIRCWSLLSWGGKSFF